MFTGIVEAVGDFESLFNGRLRLKVPDVWPDEPWKYGESVAIDGCCLTLVLANGSLEFDLSQETFSRTTLGQLKKGSRVNVERAMRADGRFGGHIVQGHVDCAGTLLDRPSNGEWRFSVGAENDKYLIDKGSVTLNGVSLTVIDPRDGEFTVALIPHTLELTALKALQNGDKVNVEFDVLAKYVAKLSSC